MQEKTSILTATSAQVEFIINKEKTKILRINSNIGVYKPQCDAEGQYLPQQCHGSTGYCWCVDSRGEERAGTRTPPGAPPVDCDRPVQPERAKTHCEHHRDSVKTTSADGYPITGVYKPQCDAEGQYLPQQCHGSTGYCWCVDSRGEERAGTRTPPGAPPVDCDRPGETVSLQREDVCNQFHLFGCLSVC
uniref:Thyroglobulin type-1 domain-containing protein n=1 Tax=Oreochromis aureus TaxID=47969 RepID=A0AAZ1XCX3_OREAU